jgi:hypothetical protein
MLAMGYRNHTVGLGITGRPPSTREIEETRKALREGIDMLRREGSPKPSLRALIWRLLQDAAETMARLPDNERRFLLAGDRIGWPEVIHTEQERFEAEVHRLTDLKMSKEEGPPPRLSITDPSAPSRALTVYGWLRHVRARTLRGLRRDKCVVIGLAGGLSPRRIRVMYFPRDAGDSAVTMVKQKVLSQLEDALRGFHNAY